MPKVDILLPYWGKFELLKQTVESVLAQDCDDWRLTVVDDHYPSDEAQKYFDSLNHPRVKYIRHEKNIGITRNFNFCVRQATAEFCVLLGCDDKLLPNYVSTALKHINVADFYQPYVDVIDADSKNYLPLGDRVKRLLQPRKSGIYSGQKLAASLCHGNWLYFPSIMWRTTTLKKYPFNEAYAIVEDVDVELSMILDGAKLYFDRTTTFQYRRFAESLSSREKGKNGVRTKEEYAVYSLFSKKFAQKGWRRAARAARAHISSRIGRFI